jgi:hypothetical protein
MVTSPFRWPPGLACGARGTAVHLALDHLDLVDGALDDPGVPGQAQAVADGVVMALVWRKELVRAVAGVSLGGTRDSW